MQYAPLKKLNIWNKYKIQTLIKICVIWSKIVKAIMFIQKQN